MHKYSILGRSGDRTEDLACGYKAEILLTAPEPCTTFSTIENRENKTVEFQPKE